MNKRNKGQFAILRVELRAAEKNIVVSKPATDVVYDLLLDDGSVIQKAQVKYADAKPSHSASGSIIVHLKKRIGSSGKIHPYTASDVDLILVYVAKIGKVICLVPKQFEGKNRLTIRYEPARNGQTKGCLFVDDLLW